MTSSKAGLQRGAKESPNALAKVSGQTRLCCPTIHFWLSGHWLTESDKSLFITESEFIVINEYIILNTTYSIITHATAPSTQICYVPSAGRVLPWILGYFSATLRRDSGVNEQLS